MNQTMDLQSAKIPSHKNGTHISAD